jgi:hypothetical protein
MTAPPTERARATLGRVALPTEHGGWGLTAEPAVLGLAIAPSVPGACLAIAALLAFLARTPLRVVLVDRHRHRDLARTALARRVLTVEVAAIVVLVVVATITASEGFWVPALVAAPFVATELWFDSRSRSRRLVPELAGAIGIGAVAPMILLAGGRPASEAFAVWLILAGRAITAIPHVRAQIAHLHDRSTSPRVLVVADAVALGTSAIAVVVEPALTAGGIAVAAVVAMQRLTARRRVPAKVVGIRQSVLGLVVVVATAAGIHLA